MRWSIQSLTQFIDKARGKTPVDLCLRGCRLINVFTGRIERVDLAVHAGLIVGWGEYEAAENLDAEGMYVCPGFIDGHIHIESTLLSPAQFGAAVLPWGTTAVIADPHEIANVLGLEGIRYFLAATESVPLDIYFNLPSCVPASPLETSGAQLKAADLRSLLPHPRLLGLAEMMNFPGALSAFPEVLEKLLAFDGYVVDGHAPGLTGPDLNAYIAAGISSDHECTTLEEAREKVSKGMALMLRQGSQSKDLAELLPVVNEFTWPHCMMVSDDRHPDDLLREGHMNAIVNLAMELGMDPVRALTLATLTPARHFRLARKGALAPGFEADFSMSRTLKPWTPERVFRRGREIARNGELLTSSTAWAQPPCPQNPMSVSRLLPEDLLVPVQPGLLRVIGVQEGTLLTRKILMQPRIENGYAVQDTGRDLLKLVVCNRYIPDRPPMAAFVHGFGFKTGAIASTVAHDSHNLIAAGATDEAILNAVNAVRKAGGGMAAASEDGSVEILPLPIAGLMSDQPLRTVVEALELLKSKTAHWGSSLHNPFMALSFLALPVIPELKLTDLGLVDVSTFSFVSLFEPE